MGIFGNDRQIFSTKFPAIRLLPFSLFFLFLFFTSDILDSFSLFVYFLFISYLFFFTLYLFFIILIPCLFSSPFYSRFSSLLFCFLLYFILFFLLIFSFPFSFLLYSPFHSFLFSPFNSFLFSLFHSVSLYFIPFYSLFSHYLISFWSADLTIWCLKILTTLRKPPKVLKNQLNTCTCFLQGDSWKYNRKSHRFGRHLTTSLFSLACFLFWSSIRFNLKLCFICNWKLWKEQDSFTWIDDS